MKKFFSLTIVVSLFLHSTALAYHLKEQGQPRLYISSENVTDVSSADAVLELIQCIFEKTAIFVQVSNQQHNSDAHLKIEKVKNTLKASLIKRNEKKPLGAFEINDFALRVCKLIATHLEIKQGGTKIKFATELKNLSTDTLYTQSQTQKSFLKENWPWIVGALVAVAGVISYSKIKNAKNESNSSSRGFVITNF